MSEVVLKDLPESWEWTKLGEVIIKIVGGGTPSKNTAKYWEGNIPWLTIKDMRTQRPADTIDHITQEAVDESSTNLIPADTVIMATRVGLGKVVRVPYATTINQDLKALITPPELDKSYLEYWLVLKAQYLGSIGSGTTVKGIRLEQVKGLDFPLAPAEQQKRIVAKIEELFSHIDAGIAALNKAKQLLKKYRQSVLKAAVTGELTKQWREDRLKDDVQGSTSAAGAGSAGAAKLEPASQLLERILQERRQKWEAKQLEQFKAKGKVPKDDGWKGKYKEPEAYELECQYPGWIKCRLDLVIDSIGGYAFKSKDFSEAGHQVVKMANIKMEVLDLDNRPSFICDISGEIVAKYKILNNDILITLTGTREKRDYGYVVHVVNNEKSLLLNQRIARLRAFLPETSKFLSAFLQSEPYRNDFFSYETGNVGQGNVGMRALTEVEVRLPGLYEQREIVSQYAEKIAASLRLEREIEKQLLKAEKNKQSILASAFSGKI